MSDRHVSIRYMIKTKFKKYKFVHEFDIWHLCKSFIKKYNKLLKTCPILVEWKESLKNHLWWAAETCESNADLLVEKFQSLLRHVIDEHEWMSDGKHINCCAHDELDIEDRDDTLWLVKDSTEHKKLTKIITDSRFTNDIYGK